MFPTAVGGPSGFFFPFGQDWEVLRINKMIRQEALPIAYRRTTFHLNDMDDVIKLLIAVGQTGRDNITSLRFLWESRNDIECRWEEFPDADDNHLRLPALRVKRFIQLLKCCKKLKHLTIHFAEEVLENVPEHIFKADAGIQGLCALQGIETLEVLDVVDESVEQHPLIKWLRRETLGSLGENEIKPIAKKT